jgi:hypothetical protein
MSAQSSPKSPSQQELLLLATQQGKNNSSTRRLLKLLKNNRDKNNSSNSSLKLNANTANATSSSNNINNSNKNYEISKHELALEIAVQKLSRQLTVVTQERNALKMTVTDLQQQLADQTAKVQALEFHFAKMNEAAIRTSQTSTTLTLTTCNSSSDTNGKKQQHDRVGSPDGSVSETAHMSDSSYSEGGNDSSLCSFDYSMEDHHFSYEQYHHQQQRQQQQAQQKLQQYANDYQVFSSGDQLVETHAIVGALSNDVEKLSVSFQRTGAKVRRAKVQAAVKRSQLTMI